MSGARDVLMRMFGHPEGVLGRLGGIIMARTNHLAAKEIIGLLDVRAADQVLEVGFGPGVGIKLLAERVTDGCVAGIDSSREMVAQATARNSDAVAGGRIDLGMAPRRPCLSRTGLLTRHLQSIRCRSGRMRAPGCRKSAAY